MTRDLEYWLLVYNLSVKFSFTSQLSVILKSKNILCTNALYTCGSQGPHKKACPTWTLLTVVLAGF